MKTRPLIPIALILLLLLAAGPVRAAAPTAATPEDAVLVRFAADLTDEEARSQLRAAGLEPVRRIPRIDVWLARPSDDSTDAATALMQLDAADTVLWAEENGIVTALDTVPDDPRYAEQWPLPLIGAPGAWDLARGMAAPIAIVDSGLDLDHGDLQAKLWLNADEIADNGVDDDGNGYIDDVYGYDIRNGVAVPQDDNGHGSHVAGTAAASSNDTYGVAGLAWETPLMAVKVLDSIGEGNKGDLAEGIIYAADNGAQIINLSLGFSTASATVEAAVSYALSKGCLLIAAAGNSNGDVLYPAKLSGVVAVAATTSADLVWGSSCQGPEVALAAPGVNVLGCNDVGGWMLKTGTSMAAPHVSGVAALVWGLRPELAYTEIADILTDTAVDIGDEGRDDYSGAGRLDAGAAVEAAVCKYRHALPVVSAH